MTTAVITSHELMQQHREIIIIHHETAYRLSITSNNKLILTK